MQNEIDILTKMSFIDLLQHYKDVAYTCGRYDERDPEYMNREHVSKNVYLRNHLFTCRDEIQRRFEELEKQLQDGEG